MAGTRVASELRSHDFDVSGGAFDLSCTKTVSLVMCLEGRHHKATGVLPSGSVESFNPSTTTTDIWKNMSPSELRRCV